ncbi:hypothetical protein WA026_015938 [Henosepilachna vigintioctopunctata]|uniref:Peptidase S54 rhomboid domain-containing protein n=1 Tax=Henosepilachna vigintioctopunctata TaxID=420089 RepID=A0AAW1U9I4_9CUCU
MRDFSLDNEQLKEDSLNSPVTTPISITDEEKYLVRITTYPTRLNTKDIWNYCVQNIPYFLLVISIAEAVFFIASDSNLRSLLRFEPRKRYQLWRYFTYMLVHEDFIHLLLNIVLQCIFAFFVEKKQGRIRVGTVYLAGGITGALGLHV